MQRLDHEVPALDALVSRKANDLPGGAKRHCSIDGLVDISSDTDFRIVAFEADALIPGAAQQIAHQVRAGHREWPRSAMNLIGIVVRYDGDKLPDAQLGVVEPRIFLAPTPNDHGELGAGLERSSNIAHRGTGRGEEHRAKAREGEVVRSAQIVCLDVGD